MKVAKICWYPAEGKEGVFVALLVSPLARKAEKLEVYYMTLGLEDFQERCGEVKSLTVNKATANSMKKISSEEINEKFPKLETLYGGEFLPAKEEESILDIFSVCGGKILPTILPSGRSEQRRNPKADMVGKALLCPIECFFGRGCQIIPMDGTLEILRKYRTDPRKCKEALQ
jgi:hypothetical protein